LFGFDEKRLAFLIVSSFLLRDDCRNADFKEGYIGSFGIKNCKIYKQDSANCIQTKKTMLSVGKNNFYP